MALGLVALLALALPIGQARAQALVADLSDHFIAITTGFVGADVLLFGAIEGDGDVVVVLRGPSGKEVVRRKGRVAGLNVTILGDILYSRVARSNIWALLKLGAKVTLCGPPTLVPKVFEQFGCRVTWDLEEALRDADVVNLLRIQHERQRVTMFPGLGEYTALFGLNQARMKWVKPDALIMHPGPINRGVEIEGEIADGPQSVILEQVTNGLAVRMAVLFLVNGGKALEPE